MNESMKYVLEKMCTYVGANYEDIDFQKNNWYWDYSWTQEQEENFCDWLINKIINNAKIRKEITTLHSKPSKKRAKETVMWFNLMWGWKTKL